MSDAMDKDLIVAVATPPGQGGIGILRVSGEGAFDACDALCSRTPRAREAVFTTIEDGDETIDEALVLWFPAPNSFTGEDVVELQTHGSPVVLQRILHLVCRRGARLARPGEFSERAFLNGKVDLAQAEAIADLIASTSVAAARAAMRSLRGEFSTRVNELNGALGDLRVLLEACIDFPDEDVDVLSEHQILARLQSLAEQLQAMIAKSQQGRLIGEGCAVALLGPPNAGKSSLLNLLSGEDAAIVTDIPGTTRDLLKVDLVLDGLPIRLVDTAGLRDASDEVEHIGIDRAQQQAQQADLVLLLLDGSTCDPQTLRDEFAMVRARANLTEGDGRVLMVLNKQDLLSPHQLQVAMSTAQSPVVVSAKTGFGIDTLRDAIKARVGFEPEQALFSARARHVDALQTGLSAIEEAVVGIAAGSSEEILAESLRSAQSALGEIVGTLTPDDLLGKIFSEFCIGK